MPLLGKRKSLGGAAGTGSTSSAGGGGQTAAAPASATTTGQQQQRAVCESPLFGVRRQLPLGTAGSGSGGSSTNQSSTAQDGELSSVPQQITRQQIHYAFSIMDANKDGMIELRELSQMLANLGVPIDEAILAHIMLSVSKRGDHRISEPEFLNWIAHFIQVSDAPSPQAASTSAGRSRRPAKESKSSRVARSSTVSSSLIAQPSEAGAAARTRRGSGSGLALMRSLSSSAAPTAASQQQSSAVGGNAPAASTNTARRPSTGAAATRRTPKPTAPAGQAEPTAESEARNDLKAAFCVFDLDGDGFITLDEVRAGLKLLGESWSPNELRRVFSRCSGDGGSTVGGRAANDLSRQRISIDDFVQLLL